MASDIKISHENWNLSRGEDLHKCAIVKRITTTESYQAPNIDEIVDEERAVLFESTTIQPCYVNLELSPLCCLHWITIVTDCQTVELFTGDVNEYYKTYCGELIDNIEGSQIFRIDIEIINIIVSRCNLKFIPKDTAFWIYGMQVAIKPNLKVMTSSLQSKIDFNNVQNILTESKHELTPNAEKCKQFLRSYISSKTSSSPSNLESIMSMMNGNLLGNSLIDMPSKKSSAKNETDESDTNKNATKQIAESNQSFDDISFRITSYVNKKMDDMEKRIQLRLEELEKQQNVKLDKILELLNKQSE